MGDHTLYFATTGRYPPHTVKRMQRLLRRYDLVVCYSDQQAELAERLGGPALPVVRIQAGPPRAMLSELGSIAPDLEGNLIMMAGSAENENRAFYKGLDVFLAVIGSLRESGAEVRATVVGELFPALRATAEAAGVTATGQVAHAALHDQMASASLYMHLARGDAFPFSVLEALAAGLPALVSAATGTREVVAQVAPWLVVPVDDVPAAVAAVRRYFALSPAERRSLSDRAREAVSGYNLENGSRQLAVTMDVLDATFWN
jgi:glycosyltransferase involved in cell wall biosynthesis